jgi:hypothetical protein
MPVSGDRRVVDGAPVAGLVLQLVPEVVVLEAVSSAPGQGVRSSFSFGRSLGVLEGSIAAAAMMLPLGLEVVRLPPAQWKAGFRLKGGRAGKQLSVDMAQQLVGGDPLPDGQAEALLMAWWWGSRWASGALGT